MDDVIAYIEGTEFIEGQLLCFFHTPANRNPVETVEYLVICITANPVALVDETTVDIFTLYEFRQWHLCRGKDGFEPLDLAFFLAENGHLISRLNLEADVSLEQFEIFIEYRLRDDVELNSFRPIFFREGYIQKNVCEGFKSFVKIPFPVHVGRIQPDHGFGREDGKQGNAAFLGGGLGQVGVDIRLVRFADGKLGIAVENMDFFDFITKERQAERMIKGIGKDVYNGAANGILPGGRYKIHLLKSFIGKCFRDVTKLYTLSFFQHENGSFHFFYGRNPFREGIRISDDEKRSVFLFIREDFAESGGPLNTQGGFVIAAFDVFAGIRKVENPVTFHEII